MIRTLSVAVLQTTFETVLGSVDRWVGGGVVGLGELTAGVAGEAGKAGECFDDAAGGVEVGEEGAAGGFVRKDKLAH